MKEYQFDGERDGARWRSHVRAYLLSKEPQIDIIFQSIEGKEDEPATAATLLTRALPLEDEKIMELPHDLWGFLTLSFQGAARA